MTECSDEANENVSLPDGSERELTRFLTEWVSDEAAVAGASVAVVSGGDVVYARGFGARDLASNRPATPDTLYGVASCTKSFTALAIMQLVESGAIDLDDPVSDHLPIELGSGERPVTIRHLLTHSSGVPADGMAYVLLERLSGIAPRDEPLSDWDDFDEMVRAGQAEATDPPGERYFYYNSGYTLLGRLVEAVSGTPYREYVQAEILDPLGMARSTFSRDEYEADDDSATPYVLDDETGLTPTDLPVDERFDPPGGLLSSARELTNYLRCCLGEGTFEGERLVSPESFAQMTAGETPVDWRRGDPGMRYGFGWTTDELCGKTLIGHEGNLGVSTAYLGFVPEADLGVVVLSNSGLYSLPHELDVVGRAALAILLGGRPLDVPFFANRAKLGRLEGRYESFRGTLTATITRDGGHLRVESEGLPPLSAPLIPESTDPDDLRFYTITGAGTPKSVAFVEDDGEVSLLFARWRLRKVG